MQAQLIPLWRTHVANAASIKSLKGTAPFLPRSLASSWRLNLEAVSAAGGPSQGQRPPPEPDASCSDSSRFLSGSSSLSSETGYLWFRERVSGVDESRAFGLRALQAGLRRSPLGHGSQGTCEVVASGSAVMLA